MTNSQPLLLARQATAQRVARQQYQLSWRGGGECEIVGIAQLPAKLGIKLQSIRVYLSKGGGTFSLLRTNPLTGEPDILTITHIPPPAPIAKRRGRPPKQQDWERLGTQAPNHPDGTLLAPPAKTVPKRTNLRTDEK